jgi:hypothetical protein
MSVPTPVHDVVPPPAQPKRTFPTWARYATVAVGSWTIGAVMLAGAGGTPTAAEPLPAVTVTAPAPSIDVTTTPEYEALAGEVERLTQELDAATSAAAPEPAPAAPAPAPAAPTTTFTMPALVGVNLQLAQDTLQAAGSYVMDQTDASGLSRLQVNDSNWQVCTQDPAPGAVVSTDTTVTLGSVKLTETCP